MYKGIERTTTTTAVMMMFDLILERLITRSKHGVAKRSNFSYSHRQRHSNNQQNKNTRTTTSTTKGLLFTAASSKSNDMTYLSENKETCQLPGTRYKGSVHASSSSSPIQ